MTLPSEGGDYQYNDNTNNIEATGGVLGSSVKSTPVST
jgi:hypothetical protein